MHFQKMCIKTQSKRTSRKVKVAIDDLFKIGLQNEKNILNIRKIKKQLTAFLNLHSSIKWNKRKKS